jgi:DNA-binding NarL/FixJ family response regulator
MTLNDLSPRRREVALLYAQRLTAAEVAERLGCKPRTVEHHVLEITDKLRKAGMTEGRGGRWLIRRWLALQAA